MSEVNPEKSKEELFKDNPEAFIHIDNIIVGAVRFGSEVGITISKTITRGDATKMLGEIQIALTKLILQGDAIVAQQNNKIIKPNDRGIFNFIRGKGR